MPSILNKDDKVVVKRAVPSPSNNIITVAVARLYVSYPDQRKWTFTGISGAVVLAEDLVGHTFFFKIVDVTVRRKLITDPFYSQVCGADSLRKKKKRVTGV